MSRVCLAACRPESESLGLLYSGACEEPLRIRGGEISEERLGRVLCGRGREHGDAVARVVLQLRRQRADELGALRLELLDLGDGAEADLVSLAADDVHH